MSTFLDYFPVFGLLLKELRNEKGLTQEQFAEIVNVSNRTVSRWENGNNMPDLDILIQISDYYEIDLRELLDGERKSDKMNMEEKETAIPEQSGIAVIPDRA